jgi:hypothetical protein
VRNSGQVYATSIIRFWSLLLSFGKWMRIAVCAGRRAFVLVNNRAEGNAPLTVQGLVGMLRD